MSFLLLGISLAYYYQNKDQLCSALSAVGLGISFTLIIVKAVTEWFGQNEIFELFFIALIIFAWFAFITYMLIKFIPHSRFNAIPLAVGAWIAGIVFADVDADLLGKFLFAYGRCLCGFGGLPIESQTKFVFKTICLLSLGCRTNCGDLSHR